MLVISMYPTPRRAPRRGVRCILGTIHAPPFLQVAKHGLSESEVEHVVRFAPRGYPRKVGGRWLVIGRVPTGETTEVVFVEDALLEQTIYVIHAMPR